MSILQAIILAIVEGVTEFLPISSTGHMILTSYLLKIPQTEFLSTFEIIIQFGAVASVLTIYIKKIIHNYKMWKSLAFSFLPTVIIGLILYGFVKHVLLGNQIVVIVSLILGGIVLLFVDFWNNLRQTTISSLSIKDSLLIGVFQSLSIIPGVSRSASTIVGGVVTGLPKTQAVEYSFMLAIPTMIAASGLDLIKTRINFGENEILLLIIGLVVAYVTALLVVKIFISLITRRVFLWFGIYRILISIIYFFLFYKQ